MLGSLRSPRALGHPVLGTGLPPSAHCFPNSLHLCTEQFLKLKLNTIYIRQARTHMHTGVCPERQDVSCTQSTKECIRPPPSKRGRACAPWSSHCTPPNNRPASCQGRERSALQPCARGKEAGTGEGSANLTSDCGVKEAIEGFQTGSSRSSPGFKFLRDGTRP